MWGGSQPIPSHPPGEALGINPKPEPNHLSLLNETAPNLDEDPLRHPWTCQKRGRYRGPMGAIALHWLRARLPRGWRL